MKKYNLTFWQWLQVPSLYMAWKTIPESQRKETFHLVLKGYEKHKHIFTRPKTFKGIRFLMCEHEGCTMHHPLD